jgi:hypothetical protein
MTAKIASIINYLVAAGMLVFGIIYLTRGSFMPYHSEAISMEWGEMDHTSQVLVLALMRTVSGGFLVCSIAIFFLQYRFSLERKSWIPMLILIIGIITQSTILYATILVRLNSPGNPPAGLAIGGTILLIGAYILNRIALRK